MELADVTDSKSVGSNTVRVRPPPSAPKIAPRSLAGCYFWCGGRENPHCAGRARMHDSGRTKSLQGRSDPNDRISTPRHTSTITNRHSPAFLVPRGRTRTVRVVQGCTIAVAQSRCTMQRPQRPHFDNPATLPLSQTGIALFFGAGGRTRTERS